MCLPCKALAPDLKLAQKSQRQRVEICKNLQRWERATRASARARPSDPAQRQSWGKPAPQRWGNQAQPPRAGKGWEGRKGTQLHK